MSPETPAIEIDRLVRRFGRADAVDGLSLRVPPGRCYGFFGRNGAGKTTTIKCLLNLLRPTGWQGQSLRTGSGPRRSGGEVASRVRPRLRGVLSMDDRARHPGLLRIVSGPLESEHRALADRPVPPRSGAEDESSVERTADAGGTR